MRDTSGIQFHAVTLSPDWARTLLLLCERRPDGLLEGLLRGLLTGDARALTPALNNA